ncbi:MAG: LuxR C-terminal-related transcriptional regulator [Longimicrobiales bacterium]|nr:LuxR C-terminal-related transcriptional regulator [Longimicrobiales bacterium]
MTRSPSTSRHIEQGRNAYARSDWSYARESLAAADAESPLGVDDLWRLAVASYLLGDEDAFVEALERAHRLAREAGDDAGAFRSAFWIGMHLGERGEGARASGWFGRAARVMEGRDEPGVEGGYLLLPKALQRFGAGDPEGAYELGREAAAIAERFGERDLLALALLVQGRARIQQTRLDEGLALLDEAMIAAATDELTPTVTGLIYCAVIGACRSVYALGRAQEWTEALNDWCERQPDMVAYTGECRVYRSELLQLHGAWGEALEEARRAARLRDEDGPATGLAHYQQGEVHRLRGELEAAEKAYRAASRAGREPQPGLALLRLAQGEEETAAAAIRRALAETASPLGRIRLLPAQIEILIAAGDVDAAGAACEELASIAASYPSPVLEATVGACRGAIRLAAGEPEAALPELRRASRSWHALDAPYEAARARLRLGLACRELGDEDGARLELEAARTAFARLGAEPDAEHVASLLQRPGRRASHGLTPRELEVIELVATGMTNRAIGEELFISEKTVARHLSNIFTKLGISSRAAATAFAYENDLIGDSA